MIIKLWDRFSGVRFIVVGVFNTIFDFSILNLLVFAFGTNNITANIISVSLAMLVSFFLNKSVVFKYSGQDYLYRLLLFLIITAFGLYIIQNVVILFFTNIFTWPAVFATDLINSSGLMSVNYKVIELNLAKASATAVTMIWNYFMYKKFVFINNENKT